MSSFKSQKVCVLGAGAFGTALAHSAAFNPYIKQVFIYARNPEVCQYINTKRSNPKFLSEFQLPNNIQATPDLAQALDKSSYILSCIPVQQMPSFIRQNKSLINPQTPFISCSKGIILESGKAISQMMQEEIGSQINYGVLSGPSYAEELMKKCKTNTFHNKSKVPTVVVVASKNIKTAKLIQLGLSTNFLKIYTQTDVIGVELAGVNSIKTISCLQALKNVLAIGAGIVQGMGYGYNTTTALLARGAREMQIYARLHGAEKSTFFGLAGIGDIMLTSFGALSRNRQFGMKIGQGEKMEDIIKNSKGVVEGLPTLELVHKHSLEHKIQMPITKVLYEFIFNSITNQQAADRLMLSGLDEEFPLTFEDLIN